MGQKLEKPSEKDGDQSGQVGGTERPAAAEPDENGQEENGSFGELNVSSQATGQVGLHTLQEARTDPQIGQPIRPQGQQDTRREAGGGVRESQRVRRTGGQTQTIPSPEETRPTPTKRRNPENKAAGCSGTVAMEEQGGQKHSGLASQGKGARCDPITEEDFVTLDDGNETSGSSGGQVDVVFEARTPVGKPQSRARPQKEGQSNFSQSSGNVLQQHATKATSRGGNAKMPSTMAGSLEVQGNRSLPIAASEGETAQREAEVTGGRCRLKAASYVGAASSRTSGKAEKEQNLRAASDSIMERQETQVERSPQIKIAGADRTRPVSRPSQDNSQGLSRETESDSPECLGSEIVLERCDPLLRPSLLGRREGEIQREIACLKRESELVVYSAVVVPQPLAHWLPERDAPEVSQSKEMDASSDSCGSKEAVELREKPRVKGPPPPVPKKPKNPFVKLKTAQLMSGDVQRRGKDHLRSEERVRRRHTFHFNKDTPWLAARNQDMCTLWDERGTYVAQSGRRPLSVDLSPWEHGSLERMDDQYGDMIDFDYCSRMGKLSPDVELQNLDMMQKRIFFERRSRFRSSAPQPPPVARKPPNPFASTETLHLPESVPDNDVLRTNNELCSERRETPPAVLSERLSPKADIRGSRRDNRENVIDCRASKDEESGGEVGSYKPVAEIVKEKNQLQRNQGRVKHDADKAQVRVTEQSSSVKVSQMKNAFDVPKKSRERQAEVQSSPKKGKNLRDVIDNHSLAFRQENMSTRDVFQLHVTSAEIRNIYWLTITMLNLSVKGRVVLAQQSSAKQLIPTFTVYKEKFSNLSDVSMNADEN